MATDCLNWDECNFDWNNNEYEWNEVCTALDLLDVVVHTYNSRGTVPSIWGEKDRLPKKLEENVIMLICKIKNQQTKTYNNPIVIRNEIKNRGIEISDINMVIKEILKIDITIMEKSIEL